MELVLVLRPARPERLVLGLPRWYRGAMALILATLAAGVALGGAQPGPLAWGILGLVALGGLYQERWEFDAAAGRVVHRAGLVFAARRTELPFASLERFRVVPGPGAGVDLVLECGDGARYFIDRRPAGRHAELRSLGGRLAERCGKLLESS